MPNLEIETSDWDEQPNDFVEIDSAASSSEESWEHVEGAGAADADVADADGDGDSNTLTPAEQQGLVDEFPALKGILSEIDGASPEVAVLDELAAGGAPGVGAEDELARQRRVAFLAEAEAAELQSQNAQQDALKAKDVEVEALKGAAAAKASGGRRHEKIMSITAQGFSFDELRMQELEKTCEQPDTEVTVQEKLQHLDMHVQNIHSKHNERLFKSTLWIRKLLSIANDPPIDEVIATGVVPRLVELLQLDANPTLQYQAAWALTNIASGTAEQTEVVVGNNAVPIFVRLLSSPNDDLREQVVWALGNIAGDSPRCRGLVLNAGALEPLLAQLTAASRVSMLRNATWTLSNFCRGKPQPQFGMVSPALPTLARLINSTDEEVLTDACWALSYLSNGKNNKIQAVIEAGVVPRLVELLAHHSPTVQTPALRTIGNIVTGDDLQTHVVVDSGALPCLLRLLNSPKQSIRKEACWTLSNITAGNQDQIQAVIDAGCIPPLVQLLAVADLDVKKEAAWAISNATSGGTPDQIREIVRCGSVKPLCDLLTAQDSRVVNVALEGIENILKLGEDDREARTVPVLPAFAALLEAGAPRLNIQLVEINKMAQLVKDAEGMETLEQLQSTGAARASCGLVVREIYQRAVKILEKYFNEEVLPPLPPDYGALVAAQVVAAANARVPCCSGYAAWRAECPCGKGVSAFTLLVLQPPPPPTIKLTSGNDKVLEVSVEVANMSVKIKEMMEKQSLDIAISLDVELVILAKVVEFCERQLQTAADAKLDPKLVSAPIRWPQDKWERQFLDVDQGTLFHMILAAHYLGIKPLLDLTCKYVADMIKGKTPEQIRAYFNIVNDFTPEEEEQMRRENAWCEDIFSEPDARTAADDAVAGGGRGSRAAGTRGVLPRLLQHEPEDKPDKPEDMSDALSDKEFEKYYAPLLKAKEMTKAGLLNPASPWTRFANCDRVFYQRTDSDASGERTLEKPAEGYKDDRSDEAFDKYYSPLMKKRLDDDLDVYVGRSPTDADDASEPEINPLALIDDDSSDEEDATDSEDDETETDRAKIDCCCPALCPACTSNTPQPAAVRAGLRRVGGARPAPPTRLSKDPLAFIDDMASASADTDKVMQLMQDLSLEFDAALVLLRTHGTVQAAMSAALTGLAAKTTTAAPAVELVKEFELQETLLKATKDTTKANPQPERFDSSHVFQVGERVRVVVGAPELEALAAGHGGWSKRMVETCGEMGTIVRVSHKCGGEGSAPSVKFDDQRSWRLNARALGPAGKAGGTKDVAAKAAPPAMVVISGAEGLSVEGDAVVDATNGRFELVGRGVYRKVGAADKWLFIGNDGLWWVGSAAHKGAKLATGWAQSVASAGGLPPASGEAMWRVTTPNKAGGFEWREPCLLKLRTLNAEEAAVENAATEAALAEAWGKAPPAKSAEAKQAQAKQVSELQAEVQRLKKAQKAAKDSQPETTSYTQLLETRRQLLDGDTTSCTQLLDGEQLFRCVAHRGVALRTRPDFAARDDSVRGPEYGEVVEARALVTTKGGATFLQRADGRGWHPMSDDRSDDVFFMPLNTREAPQGGRKAGGGGKKVQFSREPKCKTKKKTAATAVEETFNAAADLGDRMRLQLGTDDAADRFYTWWWLLLPFLVGLLCYMPSSGFYTLCKTAAGAVGGYMPSWTFWIGFVVIFMAANFSVEECYQGHGSKYRGQAGTSAAKVVKDELEDCLFIIYLGWWLVFSMFSWQTVPMALIVWALAAPERAAKALEAAKDKTTAMLELLCDSTPRSSRASTRAARACAASARARRARESAPTAASAQI